MKLKFHTSYDRFVAGGIYDVPAHLCGALLRGFATVVVPSVDDVMHEHSHEALRLMAASLGVSDVDEFDQPVTKNDLKTKILDRLSDE